MTCSRNRVLPALTSIERLCWMAEGRRAAPAVAAPPPRKVETSPKRGWNPPRAPPPRSGCPTPALQGRAP
eukprot:6808203-Pyramimonas_sp.AAC.1